METWHTCRRESTCWASSTSRAMMASSATAGQPARPRTPESSDSFIWAPAVRFGSCACWATKPPKDFTYSSARRISTASWTHMPSSENMRTRACESAIAPRSARASPARPTVTAPTGCTSHQPASRPSRHTCSTTPAVSAVGVELAIARTEVKPPIAAARVPVSTVSASSLPGWRRWVCRSTSPGSSTRPAQSTSSGVGSKPAAWAAASGPRAAIRPSATSTSAVSPVVRRALRSSRGAGLGALTGGPPGRG